MAKLTHSFPSANIKNVYTPVMTDYPTTSDYFSDASVTVPANNAVTAVFRFNRPTFADASERWIIGLSGGVGYTIAAITHASDYADADKAGKLAIVCQDGSGTSIATIISDIDVLDGEDHTVFFSYDATGGTATFIIDGNDADDTGNADRVLTTGTLDTGAGSMYVGKATTSLYSFVDGQIGFLGVHMEYLTNWTDFMDVDGAPKKINEDVWSGWGGQPLYWNEHGAMNDNRGSETNMTENGNPLVTDEVVFETGFEADTLWNDSVTGHEKLLLNFNGTDASTTITDDTGNHTATANGDAQLDTSLKKFGSASLILDGTGDYVSIPYVTTDFDWFAEDYTFDCWVYATTFADWSALNGQHLSMLIGRMSPSGNSNAWSFGPINTGHLRFYYFNGSQQITTSTATIPTSEWVHLAFTYDVTENTVHGFINGELALTTALSGTITSSEANLIMGAHNNQALTGQIDGFRITKGINRYSEPTIDFTPSTVEPSA